MALSVGTRLGPYEIVEPLGAGGMGEVYKGRDTRLERTVAVKILSASLTNDPTWRQRFDREARVLAALSNPHICPVFDVGSQDQVDFLVMEYLEGETLAARLARGPLPVDQALRHGVEIADALAAAHSQGVCHRDLKPGNIILTRSGARLLDFGLARLGPPPSSRAPDQRTISSGLTGKGTILGTVQYMAPEQLEGKQTDARTDIFAFGAVVYEMVTGRKAFEGQSRAGVIAAILEHDPPAMSSMQRLVPPALDRVVRKCLGKDPEERWQNAQDLRDELKWIAEGLLRGEGRSDPHLVVTPKRPPSRAFVVGAACAGLALAALAGYWAARQGQRAAPPLRFERLTYRLGHFVNARFAPDGQTVFYAATWEGRPRELFQARRGTGGELSLGQPGADLLSVSRSGDLAVVLPRMRGANPYRKSGTLAVLPASGGTPRELAEDIVWADWAPDGQSMAVIRSVGAGRQLEYPLGTVLYRVPDSELIWPRVSPDGNRVALFERADIAFSVVVIDRSGARRVVSPGWADWWNLAWSPRGDEIWFGGARAGAASALHAVSLNGVERRLLEAPVTLELHDVRPDGRALVAGVRNRNQMFGREKGAPQESSSLAWLEQSTAIDLSDDGQRLLFTERSEREGGKIGVYLRDLNGAAAIRLGDGVAQDLSSDGKWALALRGGEIAALPTGAGVPRVRALPNVALTAARFLPDGDRIVLVAREGAEGQRLFVTGFRAEPLHRSGPEIALRPRDVLSWSALMVSPDGRLVAYAEAGGGISVVRIEGGEIRRVPEVGVNDLPVQWTPDGRRLFVFDPGEIPARLFALDIERGERRLVREIQPRDPVGVSGICCIAITRDGQAYAYSYAQNLSDLFLVEGLQ